MDHTRLLNEMRSRANLSRAFEYACFDRVKTDYYFDLFELEYARARKKQILDELEDELAVVENYRQRLAYAYYPPKTDLCNRRMVYVSFKDLVVRYAFVIVIARALDCPPSPPCFANQRATGERARVSLLADFAADSWPRFCAWQKVQAQKHSTLLRTDISSFYDSISHDYLVDTVASGLAVPRDSQLMVLFRQILTVPVLSYSQQTGRVAAVAEMRQGLPIGNNTEGFFANVCLRDVDRSLSSLDVDFGRYNDDMRIFGATRHNVLSALRVLQELLLTKGLNLNAAKTKLTEDRRQMEELRSSDADVYQYFPEKDDCADQDESVAPPTIAEELDKSFDEFDRTFRPDQSLTDNKDGKDFCKFLAMQSRDGSTHGLRDRIPDHIRMLVTVLRKWRGSSRHAAWLLVESAFHSRVSRKTRALARVALLRTLTDGEVDSYAKYRMLHHLVKPRKGRGGVGFRYLDGFSEAGSGRLRTILPALLSTPAFELAITTLYVYRVLGASGDELRDLLVKHVPSHDAEPYKNALSYIAEPGHDVTAVALGVEDEPDETIEPY